LRLSKQSNYAIRALIYCAANPSGLSRIRDIGQAFGVSEMFLFKILVPIGRSGLLTTVRGRNGGVRLGAPANQITVMDVLRVTEEDFDLSECVRERCEHCPLSTHCRYETALSDALRAFTKVLESYTIADLVADHDNVVSSLGLADPKSGERASWQTQGIAART
jgi:Rrf2 family iron-responsive transcriptional regulator